jgi:hypothetical protein
MADDEAQRLMLAIQRNTWEGEIELSGQWRCFDWDTTSDTYGSGKPIVLYWSPLGISNTKFKVTRMIMKRLTTSIYVNNVDPLVNNRITRTMGNQERSESFLGQTGVAETVFCYTYNSAAIDTATDPLYMELENSGGTDLWHRVKCVKFTDTANNLRVYHALFPAGFTGGLNGIDRIKLYTAATGGTLIETIELTRTVDSIVIDEAPEKLFLSDLIIEVLAPNS